MRAECSFCGVVLIVAGGSRPSSPINDAAVASAPDAADANAPDANAPDATTERAPLAGYPWQIELTDPLAGEADAGKKNTRLGFVSIPLGAREPRPIMIALHGGSDRP